MPHQVGRLHDNIKGSVILGHLKFIEERWGKAAVKDVSYLIGLAPMDIVESKWYTADYSNTILAWIAERKGPECVEECGRYTVKNLGLLQYIVRFMSMESLLKKAKINYMEGFDYGEISVEMGDKRAVVKMKDVARSQYSCPAWLGVLRGIFELTHTTGTVWETKCQRQGADCCQFVLEWH